MKRILVVEDDVALSRIYEKKLTDLGYRVRLAMDGKAALQALCEDIPNLVLLDIMLPGGQNGFDILRQIRENEEWKNIPVLVLTNLDTEEQTATSYGVVDYLVKTNISIDDVMSKVKKIVGE